MIEKIRIEVGYFYSLEQKRNRGERTKEHGPHHLFSSLPVCEESGKRNNFMMLFPPCPSSQVSHLKQYRCLGGSVSMEKTIITTIIYNENDPHSISLQDENEDLQSKNGISWIL